MFEGGKPVSVLLDHQRPATLVRPSVLRVDPGNIGTAYPFLRTRLEGSFQALLTGFAIKDEQEPQFAGAGFESEAFAAWYGGPFSATTGDGFRTKSIEVAKPEQEIINVDDLGHVEATRLAYVKTDHSTSEVRTRSILRITFDRLRSLREAMELCLGLELVFGFLVGFRPKLPIFRLWLPPARRDSEDVSTTRDAELELGGVYFRDGPTPHPMQRFHCCGQGGTGLREMLKAYSTAPVDIVTRIHAVQLSRWFSASLNDKFAAVMPVFEKYVKATFKSPEEESFLAHKEAFFAYVDAAPDPAIIEFSKKHLQMRDRKSPSLPTLIGRTIDSVTLEGFRFDSRLAKRISDRRATMFHSAPLMAEADALSFFEETQAVTALLMLRTLADLEVKIASLSNNHFALSDFPHFLKDGPAA